MTQNLTPACVPGQDGTNFNKMKHHLILLPILLPIFDIWLKIALMGSLCFLLCIKRLVCRDAKMPVSTQRDGKFEISTHYKRPDNCIKNHI